MWWKEGCARALCRQSFDGKAKSRTEQSGRQCICRGNAVIVKGIQLTRTKGDASERYNANSSHSVFHRASTVASSSM